MKLYTFYIFHFLILFWAMHVIEISYGRGGTWRWIAWSKHWCWLLAVALGRQNICSPCRGVWWLIPTNAVDEWSAAFSRSSLRWRWLLAVALGRQNICRLCRGGGSRIPTNAFYGHIVAFNSLWDGLDMRLTPNFPHVQFKNDIIYFYFFVDERV